jgi:hypothetical protein
MVMDATQVPKANCVMTNVMYKLSIYISIYFCLTCFGLSFSPSSMAGVQFWHGSSLLGKVSVPGC